MSEKNLTQEQLLKDVEGYGVAETTVYINVIVDSQEIINKFDSSSPQRTPSKNPNSPSGLTPQDISECIYMVATRGDVISGHGKGDLKVHVYNQDRLRWTATTETQNSDCTATLYAIAHTGGDEIMRNICYAPLIQKVFVPSDTDPLKGTIKEQFFPAMSADTRAVSGTKTESYIFKFSIYARKRGSDPYLFGYFYLDPYIQIN